MEGVADGEARRGAPRAAKGVAAREHVRPAQQPKANCAPKLRLHLGCCLRAITSKGDLISNALLHRNPMAGLVQCEQLGARNLPLLVRTLTGWLLHPNVGACLVLQTTTDEELAASGHGLCFADLQAEAAAQCSAGCNRMLPRL